MAAANPFSYSPSSHWRGRWLDGLDGGASYFSSVMVLMPMEEGKGGREVGRYKASGGRLCLDALAC